MLLPRALAASLALVLVVAACAGAPAPGAEQPTPTPAAVATDPPAATPPPGDPPPATPPVAPPPPVGVGSECAGYPQYDPAYPDAPEFPPDPALEAAFPTHVDGEPVEDVETVSWLAFMCWIGGQPMVDQLAAAAPGLNLAGASFGSASVLIGDDWVNFHAMRFPGQDAGAIVQHLGVITAALGGEAPEFGTLTTTNLGGKNVYVWTGEDGEVSYFYARGDILIGIDDDQVTPEQAARLFAALP